MGSLMRTQLAVSLLLAVGCSSRAAPTLTKELAVEPVATTTRDEGELDTRDQYALMAELAATHEIDDIERLDDAYTAIRSRWEGRRYRWEVRSGYCARERCWVNAIDYAKLGTSAPPGALPEVAWSEGERAKLQEQCEGIPSCVVRMEATLSELQLASDLSLALKFTNGRVLDTRAARPGENWSYDPTFRVDSTDPGVRAAREEFQRIREAQQARLRAM